MQFQSIIAVLSMALAATAAPSANGSPPPPTCSQGSTVACCETGNSGIEILGLNCLLPIAQCGILNGGQQACCQTTASGTINLQLPCQLL